MVASLQAASLLQVTAPLYTVDLFYDGTNHTINCTGTLTKIVRCTRDRVGVTGGGEVQFIHGPRQVKYWGSWPLPPLRNWRHKKTTIERNSLKEVQECRRSSQIYREHNCINNKNRMKSEQLETRATELHVAVGEPRWVAESNRRCPARPASTCHFQAPMTPV